MQLAISIKKSNKEKQLVYGELYPSGVPDSDFDFMDHSDLEDTAHRFLMRNDTRCIDIQHNGELVEAWVVQSWMQDEPSTLYRLGSWVIVVKIEDPDVWAAIKANDLNGFSMEATGWTQEVEVEVEVPEYIKGETLPANEHKHEFVAFFSANGRFTGGETDEGIDGHTHLLKRGTLTEPAPDGHTHRYGSVYNFIEL